MKVIRITFSSQPKHLSAYISNHACLSSGTDFVMKFFLSSNLIHIKMANIPTKSGKDFV